MRISDGCVLVRRIFQFNDADGNSVDEEHNVRPSVFLALVHLELIDCPENIVGFASVVVLLIVDIVDVD